MITPRSSLKNFFDGFHFSTFIIALVAATAALWLNSQYVSNEVYAKNRQILLLKVENLEKETESIRFLVGSNRDRLQELAAVVIKIESLISKLISDDGEIILSREMKQLEVDIAEIRRDISYIKASERSIKEDISAIRRNQK